MVGRTPARRLESAGGDLSSRNRLVRVMTEETSIKKFDDLPPGLVRAYSYHTLKSGDNLNRRALVAGAATAPAIAIPAGFSVSRRSTRSRRSPESDFGIAHPEKENQCPKPRSSITLWESHRFKSAGNRFREALINAAMRSFAT